MKGRVMERGDFCLFSFFFLLLCFLFAELRPSDGEKLVALGENSRSLQVFLEAMLDLDELGLIR